MTEKKLIQFYVVVDEDGDYETASYYDDAMERYNDNIGGEGLKRVIRVPLKVTLPRPLDIDPIDVSDETV